jgi:hypothetical protein
MTSCITSEGENDQPVSCTTTETTTAYQPPTPPPRVPIIEFPAHDTIHRIFTVYSPGVVFTSDSGATDILIRACDLHILTDYTAYNATKSPPGFDVTNYHQIFPIAYGKLSIPNTTITLDAFVFHDDDLHSNLFGIAPLTQHGLSATRPTSLCPYATRFQDHHLRRQTSQRQRVALFTS